MCLLLCKEVAKSTKYTFTTAPELENPTVRTGREKQRGREDGYLEIKTLSNISEGEIATGGEREGRKEKGSEGEGGGGGSSGGQPQHQDKSASSLSHQQSSL